MKKINRTLLLVLFISVVTASYAQEVRFRTDTIYVEDVETGELIMQIVKVELKDPTLNEDQTKQTKGSKIKVYFAGVTHNEKAALTEIKAAQGLLIKGWYSKIVKCESFTVSIKIKGKTIELHSRTNITEEIKEAIGKLNSGNKIHFNNIMAKGKDGTIRSIPGIVIIVK